MPKPNRHKLQGSAQVIRYREERERVTFGPARTAECEWEERASVAVDDELRDQCQRVQRVQVLQLPTRVAVQLLLLRVGRSCGLRMLLLSAFARRRPTRALRRGLQIREQRAHRLHKLQEYMNERTYK